MRAFAILVLLVLLAGCSAKGPTPPTAPSGGATPTSASPSALAPGDVRLAVGDSWAYRITDANGTDQGTQETSVLELTGTTAIVSTRTDGGAGRSSTSRLEARQGDLAVVSLSSDLGFTITYDPPLPLVIPAADHAQSGRATLKGPTGSLGSDVNLSVRYLGSEKVVTPGGGFDALRYHIVIETGGAASARQESDVWFAPSVKAPVKTVEASGRLQELTGYHVG